MNEGLRPIQDIQRLWGNGGGNRWTPETEGWTLTWHWEGWKEGPALREAVALSRPGFSPPGRALGRTEIQDCANL